MKVERNSAGACSYPINLPVSNIMIETLPAEVSSRFLGIERKDAGKWKGILEKQGRYSNSRVFDAKSANWWGWKVPTISSTF